MYGFNVRPSAAPRGGDQWLEDLSAHELGAAEEEEREDPADVERQKDDPAVVAHERDVRDHEEPPATAPDVRLEEGHVREGEEEREDELPAAELEVAPVLGREARRSERPRPGVRDSARAEEEMNGGEDHREESDRRDLHPELGVPEERERREEHVVAPVVIHRHVVEDGEREPRATSGT